MRKIKASGIAEGRVERRELFSAFEILCALTLIECEGRYPIVLLFDQFLLMECLCFRFAAEMLPITPFPHFRPSHTVEGVSIDVNFAKLRFSFLHSTQWRSVRLSQKLPIR